MQWYKFTIGALAALCLQSSGVCDDDGLRLAARLEGIADKFVRAENTNDGETIFPLLGAHLRADLKSGKVLEAMLKSRPVGEKIPENAQFSYGMHLVNGKAMGYAIVNVRRKPEVNSDLYRQVILKRDIEDKNRWEIIFVSNSKMSATFELGLEEFLSEK